MNDDNFVCSKVFLLPFRHEKTDLKILFYIVTILYCVILLT